MHSVGGEYETPASQKDDDDHGDARPSLGEGNVVSDVNNIDKADSPSLTENRLQ